MLSRTTAVAAALARKTLSRAKGREVAQSGVGHHDDVTASPAVASVRTALGDELLTPKAEATVTASTGPYVNARPVVEHDESAAPETKLVLGGASLRRRRHADESTFT